MFSLSIRFSRELLEKVREQAQRGGVKPSTLVRQAVEEKLQRVSGLAAPSGAIPVSKNRPEEHGGSDSRLWRELFPRYANWRKRGRSRGEVAVEFCLDPETEKRFNDYFTRLSEQNGLGELRYIVNGTTLTLYEWSVSHGYKGSLAQFLHEVVRAYFKDNEIELVKVTES